MDLFEIGQIVPASQGVQAFDENGKSYLLGEGYQHFK
jgi:hypothetical protein